MSPPLTLPLLEGSPALLSQQPQQVVQNNRSHLPALQRSRVQQVHRSEDVGGADELAVLAPCRGAELGAQLGSREAISSGERKAELCRQAREQALARGPTLAKRPLTRWSDGACGELRRTRRPGRRRRRPRAASRLSNTAGGSIRASARLRVAPGRVAITARLPGSSCAAEDESSGPSATSKPYAAQSAASWNAEPSCTTVAFRGRAWTRECLFRAWFLSSPCHRRGSQPLSRRPQILKPRRPP